MKAVSGLKIALNAIPIRGRLPMVARQAPSSHAHAGACRLIRTVCSSSYVHQHRISERRSSVFDTRLLEL